MEALQVMRDVAAEATQAFTAFAIVVNDEATPALESLMDALCALRQWGEVERLVSGEYAPFVLREVTNA